MDLSSRRRSVLAGIAGMAVVALIGAVLPSVQAREATADSKLTTVRDGLWRPNGSVLAIAYDKKRIYVGGDFTSMTGPNGEQVSRYRIAALNRKTGALVKSFHPRFNGAVKSLALHRGALYVGGYFTKVKGHSRHYLAALRLPKYHLLKHWKMQLNAPVLALRHMGKRLYVGGQFTRVGKAKRARLFAVGPKHKVVKGWPTVPRGANGSVNALAAAPGHRAVLVGGHFHELAGRARVNLGAVTVGGGRTTRWAPKPFCLTGCPIRDLAVRKKVVIAGIDGPGGRVRAYRWSNAHTKWGVVLNGEVDAVAVAGGDLLVGGHFATVAGESRPMLAVLDVKTGVLTDRTFTTGGPLFPGVLEIGVKDGVALVGGAFDDIDGQSRLAAIAP
jgi:hypothetical protein